MEDLWNFIAVSTSISILVGLVYILQQIEPFCYYIPWACKTFYKIHNHTDTKFTDIIGGDDIKEELSLHINLFQQQTNDSKKLSKGFLFTGPSGTGKTMMARAIATETKLPFVEIFTNDIASAYIPLVLNIVIKKHSPCIIFMDECSNMISTYNDTLLRKLDGIVPVNNIFLILATTENVNNAITRSGRIDKIIKFSLPKFDDRLKLLKKLGLSNPENLAAKTSGLSYADISIIPRELNFRKHLDDSSESKMIDDIIHNIKYGQIISKYSISKELKSRIAYHELGHLLLAYLLDIDNKPNKIALKQTDNMLGFVSLDDKDIPTRTSKAYLKEITVLLASSVFEIYFCQCPSTLFRDDIEKINKIFNDMNDCCMFVKDSTIINFIDQKDDLPDIKNKIVEELCHIIYKFIYEHEDLIKTLHIKLMDNLILYYDDFDQLIKDKLLYHLDIQYDETQYISTSYI